MMPEANWIPWSDAIRLLETRWQRRRITGIEPEELAQETCSRVWKWRAKGVTEAAQSAADENGTTEFILIGFARNVELECLRVNQRERLRIERLHAVQASDDARHLGIADTGHELASDSETEVARHDEAIATITRGVHLAERDRRLLHSILLDAEADEMARQLGCTTAAVYSRKHRLFEKIRAARSSAGRAAVLNTADRDLAET